MGLREISFEILQSCPNNCIYCSSESHIKCTDIIDFDFFRPAIDDAVELGLRTLCISGGEPFQHPRCLDMVEYAKKHGLTVFVYTSGVCVENDKYRPLDSDVLVALRRLNTDKLIFNIQAAEGSLYDRIMGTRGNFDIMKQSAVSASEAGLFTEAHFVPMKINYKQIDEVMDLSSALGIRKVSFLRLVIQGRALLNRSLVELTDEEQEELVKTLLRVRSGRNGVDVRIGVPLSQKSENKKCIAASEKLIIKYDGTVFPCEAYKYISSIGDEKIILPDSIYETRLRDIWETSDFLRVLRADIESLNACSVSHESCPAQYRLHMIGR